MSSVVGAMIFGETGVLKRMASKFTSASRKPLSSNSCASLMREAGSVSGSGSTFDAQSCIDGGAVEVSACRLGEVTGEVKELAKVKAGLGAVVEDPSLSQHQGFSIVDTRAEYISTKGKAGGVAAGDHQAQGENVC